MSEVSVYWVGTEITRFRSLLFDLPEIPTECLFFHNGPKHVSWPTPPVYFDDFMAPDPDIWDLSAGTTIATTPSTIERLEPFVSMAAEVLPLENRTGEELEFVALNVVNTLDIERCMELSLGGEERRRQVDESAADLSPSDAAELLRGLEQGDPWPVLYPAFRPECLGEPTLFTISRFGTMFCVERDDRDDSLMRRLDGFEITGLTFTKLWSSVTGPEPINLFRP